MTAIICLCSIIIGLMIGFPLGFLFKKQKIDIETHRQSFDLGFEFGKESFYNPEAKG